jgi:hypothetical protein
MLTALFFTGIGSYRYRLRDFYWIVFNVIG